MVISAASVIAAAVLALAGAQKLLDPSMTVGALQALRLPHRPTLVRVGAAAETGVGAAAIVSGGALLWGIVGLSYLAFAGFVLLALRRGTAVASCGCFGRDDVPPQWSLVAVNVALGAASAGAAVVADVPWDSRPDSIWAQAVALVALAVGVVVTWAAYVELPPVLRGTAELRQLSFAVRTDPRLEPSPDAIGS
jgi:hypothetical protein